MDTFKKILKLLMTGKIVGVLHSKIFIYFIPKHVGDMKLCFYKLLYPEISIGKNTTCWGSIILTKTPDSRIKIGDNVRIVSDFVRAGIALYSKLKIQAFGASIIEIGNNVAMCGTSITCRTTSITIEDGVMIAPNVIIVDSDFHGTWPPSDRLNNMGYENDRPVRISKNVWIGINSIVLKGVTIGENSIIAAGSVVIKDIPANVIAAGNPACVKKKLQ